MQSQSSDVRRSLPGSARGEGFQDGDSSLGSLGLITKLDIDGMAKIIKKRDSTAARFAKDLINAGVLHEGPALGVLHLGFVADGQGNVPFQRDDTLAPKLIPKGTKWIEVVSVVAVLEFTDQHGNQIGVPVAELQTWTWAAKKSAKVWYVRNHVEFRNAGLKFNWSIGLNQSFFFFG
jgi:hypothetical protein